MPNTKAITDFSDYLAGELGPVAARIHEQMSANAAVFASPIVTMAALGNLVGDYNIRVSARSSRATADALAYKRVRKVLESALGVLGNYVNNVARGDAMIVEKSGFPSYQTGHTVDVSPPGAPMNLRLRHGDLSGIIVARYKVKRRSSTNEVQITNGNPGTEADWRMVGIFQGQKARITGLTPGKVVWVRVRTVGLRGVMGEWSDPAQIMVI